MRSEMFFLDSAYAIALISIADQYHTAAARIATSLKNAPTHLVTTPAVLLEIGNALAKPGFRSLAVELLKDFERDPQLEIVPLDDRLFRSGFELFESRKDKAWSLTDCISFVVMKERDLGEALTSDQHFEQAGFKALLRE